MCSNISKGPFVMANSGFPGPKSIWNDSDDENGPDVKVHPCVLLVKARRQTGGRHFTKSDLCRSR